MRDNLYHEVTNLSILEVDVPMETEIEIETLTAAEPSLLEKVACALARNSMSTSSYI